VVGAHDGRALGTRGGNKVTITQRRRNPQRWWTGLAVVVALSLVGAACGDDDDDAATDDTPAADSADSGSDTTAAAAAGDSAAFCQARVDLEAQFGAEQPDVAAVTAVLEDFQAAAPADLAENVTGLSEALAGAAESGGDPAEDPAFAENIDPIDQYVLAECGFEQVDVSATEYKFEGVPATVPAGTVAVNLTNDGTEAHEMIMFKRADGEDRTIDELLALPEEQMFSALSFAGAAMADPGKSGVSIATLDPGRYIAVCFLPAGGNEGSPPHFMQGMTAEFEVA
jgi:hypothetical protein